MNKEIEYLKEHLYEIYKYKKSMRDLTYDMNIEYLLRTCKALDYSEKEIERLNKELSQEKDKNEKVFKIIDEAMTKNMIIGEATINLLEILAILKRK